MHGALWNRSRRTGRSRYRAIIPAVEENAWLPGPRILSCCAATCVSSSVWATSSTAGPTAGPRRRGTRRADGCPHDEAIGVGPRTGSGAGPHRRRRLEIPAHLLRPAPGRRHRRRRRAGGRARPGHRRSGGPGSGRRLPRRPRPQAGPSRGHGAVPGDGQLRQATLPAGRRRGALRAHREHLRHRRGRASPARAAGHGASGGRRPRRRPGATSAPRGGLRSGGRGRRLRRRGRRAAARRRGSHGLGSPGRDLLLHLRGEPRARSATAPATSSRACCPSWRWRTSPP